MKKLVGSVDLQNRLTGQWVAADLFRGLDQRNFDDYTNLWKPELDKARARASSWLGAAAVNAQDGHWEWPQKAVAASSNMGQETFAIECDGKTQGMLLVDLTQFTRLDEQKNLELVYVDLVATAPWNRTNLVPNPIYRGIGRVLIATAISLSIDLEFKGRLGLHSLPQSETWYAQQAGFTNLGLDQPKKMLYFEATEVQARTFLESK